MKFILQVNGEEMTFSELELTAIVEKHFLIEAGKVIEKGKEPERTQNNTNDRLEIKPVEGIWFRVEPLTIDQELFAIRRLDERQEGTRQIILDAFEQVNSAPIIYGRPFETFMPKKKIYDSMRVEQMREIASRLGDHMANWIEQALEWAQRIHNGETWENLCNKPDLSNWYRLVVWKNGKPRLVGGTHRGMFECSSTYVDSTINGSKAILHNAVPLVVRYK